MRVTLAGYNTDVQNRASTPETLSAAYARISRDPRPVGELRREAAREVSAARASNRRIVFGFGHGSVAEHAVLSFDVTGISRLASEALQDFRLASFTEKSQRYVRLDGSDVVVPVELRGEDADSFAGAAGRLFDSYGRIYEGLLAAGMPESVAREDARYVLPLATSCQMGMTVNARELEHMVRRLAAHPAGEVRELASGLLSEASAVAPSLMRYTEPTPMDRFALTPYPVSGAPADSGEMVLLGSDDDSRIGEALLARSRGMPLPRGSWEGLGPRERAGLFESALAGLGPHDPVPREWELLRADFRLTLSASAYAQLKRHRICTRLASGYDPGLGLTVPPSLERAGLSGVLLEAAGEAVDSAAGLGCLPGYLLTNAHRRVVLLSMNGRALYHFSRLREDPHAQWDIRRLAGLMMRAVSERAPLSMMRAGGRQSF